MAVTEAVGALLVLAGSAWMLLGALGLLRFPDVYTRLHGVGLGSTGGAAMMLAGVAVYFIPDRASLGALAILSMVFVLLTYPLATTAVIYAAHATRAPKHRGTVADELAADAAGVGLEEPGGEEDGPENGGLEDGEGEDGGPGGGPGGEPVAAEGTAVKSSDPRG